MYWWGGDTTDFFYLKIKIQWNSVRPMVTVSIKNFKIIYYISYIPWRNTCRHLLLRHFTAHLIILLISLLISLLNYIKIKHGCNFIQWKNNGVNCTYSISIWIIVIIYEFFKFRQFLIDLNPESLIDQYSRYAIQNFFDIGSPWKQIVIIVKWTFGYKILKQHNQKIALCKFKWTNT